MPELPEVETIKRELKKVLVGEIISQVEILWPKTILPSSIDSFKEKIIGEKILGLERKAKMLLFHLNEKTTLISHLKMTGQLIFVSPNKIKTKIISGGHPTKELQMPGKHTRVIFYFNSGNKLYFNDLRKFGWIKILDEKIKNHLKTKIGMEPLEKGFTVKYFTQILNKYPNKTIKQILLDQELIAGIGNIYADESAFLSNILPTRKTKTLSKKEIDKLHKKIVEILKLAIQKKGTSSKNYVRSDGSSGGFVPYLMVYNRNKLPCKKCKTLILKIKHAGRGTHFCPKCQK